MATRTVIDSPILELNNISKSFSGVPALTNVTFDIRPGEVHALLGENGAGKSTLMNIATGTLPPSSGEIRFEGAVIAELDPYRATELGIAFVHQHPAVMPDLTVLENIQVALPRSVFPKGTPDRDFVQGLLDTVHLDVPLNDRVEDLSVANKHLLEIAKALALNPKVLVLDEPTAPLGQDSVALLFNLVREAVAGGTSVVYITHRLAEVREVATRVTVLRDGLHRKTSPVSDVSDSELLALIIGRELESTFPAKYTVPERATLNLVIKNLTGRGFTDVSIEAYPGQIIGIGGVLGNGQSALLKAIGGLESFEGSVEIGGQVRKSRELLTEAALMPADRQHEGVMMRMSVRENAAVAALRKFKNGVFLSRKKEDEAVNQVFQSLSVKTPSNEALVSALSGGNQQKVVMSRALLSDPLIVLADEPTQGVDVGARAELYQILRDVSQSGIPVIIASSDAKELEGLCDTVYVLSRGHVVSELRGDAITEENMISAAVTSTTQVVDLRKADEEEKKRKRNSFSAKAWRFARGDYAPSALLFLVMLGLGAYILSTNDKYLSAFNISSMLLLATALGFIALGQTIALLTGGLDLSVGPLAGLLVVVISFFATDGFTVGSLLLGFLAMMAVSMAVGFVNGSLIRFVRFTAVAATLGTYIALQGFSFVLRDAPDGFINTDITAAITYKLGPIPVAFIALVIAAVVMEWLLRSRPWGWRLRAVGSEEEAARRVGVPTNRTVIVGYMLTSFFTFFGAIMLMAQLGIGDPSQGIGYTLSSITAVVLGGTSLLGGRGSFIGTLFGSLLLIQVLNATVFLGLDQTWQYILQGLLILIAAIVYSVARSRRR
jgi:ribose transport system ATP-binding protein